MVQATAGGGGRGICLAKEPNEFVKLLQVSLSLLTFTINYKETVAKLVLHFRCLKYLEMFELFAISE